MLTYDKESRGVENIIKNDILPCLSAKLKQGFSNFTCNDYENLTEIRIRTNKPVILVYADKERFLDSLGGTVSSMNNGYVSDISDLSSTIQLMSEHSLYAFQEEIRNGYLTLLGGHRVGIAGKIVTENNAIKTIKDISSINIRVARQVKGCADKVIKYILNNNEVHHTLIISPPNCGKTTLLRDIIRQISDGINNISFIGLKVGVVDERSEIAACYKGIPQNNIGIRTDVLDNCPKGQGIILLTRSMSPQVIATDELGTKEDIKAIEEALNAGIKIITTAHASTIEELFQKPNIGNLVKQNLFERIIVLNSRKSIGNVEDILDGKTLRSVWRVQNAS